MKRVLLGFCVVAVVLLGWDVRRPIPLRWSTQVADGAIGLYQDLLSERVAKAGVQCRFEPSCSRYARAAVQSRGAWRGGALAAGRVVRCGPWTPAGTIDPPPETLSGRAAGAPALPSSSAARDGGLNAELIARLDAELNAGRPDR